MLETTLQLGPADAGRVLSRAEFAAADYVEPFTYERVRGRLVVMSPVGPEHRGVSRPFRRELGGYWCDHRDVVDDVDPEGWVATSEDDDRIPDLCVYLAGPSSHLVVPQRVPDLIFEFVSGNRADQEHDYVFKRAEYEAIGVREYVVVDRFKREVLVLRLDGETYAETVLDATSEYETPLLPGLVVPLTEVFPE